MRTTRKSSSRPISQASGLADRCTIQVAYAIGVSRPLSVYVDTYGTGNVDEEKLAGALREVMDLSPRGIREHLGLSRPIYARTAAYGHFGREPEADGGFSWEKTDLADTLRSAFGLQFYVSFVLSLALAFGIAFELPVVVVFLAMTRIVPTRVMARSRRYVIFGIFVSTALLTPPDVVSQILLALPMIVLFEAGLLAAKLMERGRDPEKSDGLFW